MGNQHGLRCPDCMDDGAIDIQARIWTRISNDGSDADASHDGTHEWDDDSPALCNNCGKEGKVSEFRDDAPHFVNWYLCNRAYGGPEEGGWWYDTREPLGPGDDRIARLSIPCASAEEALEVLRAQRAIAETINAGAPDLNSVNCWGVHEPLYERHEPEAYPKTRPRYE